MWLIRTKLEPPAPTDRLIPRHRLRKRLPALLKSRLTLVHAPAGFGKTSLLAEWARCLRNQNVRIAWLSVDEDDAEPLQFFAYLTAALEASGIELGHLGPAAARGFPDVPVTSIVAALTGAIERSTARTVIIIDDYHRLGNHRQRGDAIGNALAKLIDTLTSRISFVIASRSRPSLHHLAARRAETPLEISAEELRFTVEESRRLLNPSVAALSEEDLHRLASGADGWAIALTTVRQWLGAGWRTDQVLAALASPRADLRSYLTEQILRSLEPAQQTFLRRTCVVDRFSRDLAVALCPNQPVDELIATFERKDLLMSHWDGGERWLRYHRLLSDTALVELRSEAPSDEQALHRAAAEWFFDAGLHAEAVRHALATGDEDLLAGLFERAGGWWLVVTGNIGLARNALTRIPASVLRKFPRSHLAWILMLGKQGKVAEARKEFDQVEALLKLAAPPSASIDGLLEYDAAIIGACVARYEDARVTREECVVLAQRAASLPQDRHVLRATYGNILCAMYFEAGDLPAALAVGEEAVMEYRQLSSIFGEVFVYVHQGCALLESGRLRDAEALLRQALHLARDTTGPNTETEAVAACMLGVALYENGDMDAAEALLQPALTAMEHGESWYELLARSYDVAAAIARRRGGLQASLAVVHQVRLTAAARDLGRLEEFADLLELTERTFAGEFEGAVISGLEAATRARLAARQSPRVQFRQQLALARLELQRDGIAAAALKLLDSLIDETRAAGHWRVHIEALAVRALALQTAGEHWRARREFDAAVSLAMFEGYRQLFRDLGPALLPLAQAQAISNAEAQLPRVRDMFVNSIVDYLHQLRRDEPAAALLSERERAVLRLLAQGLANKAIARALQVSDNTIKFHLKNIFTKLGVTSRAEAARALHADENATG
jgi:LuxR family transcriptional regulator, maltose regulon positive regulatory protein